MIASDQVLQEAEPSKYHGCELLRLTRSISIRLICELSGRRVSRDGEGFPIRAGMRWSSKTVGGGEIRIFSFFRESSS